MSGSGSPSRGSPSRSQRRPLHERSKSQSNSLAIRIVPYSPPRPSDKNRESAVSASSSRTPTSTTALLSYPSGYDAHASSSWTDDRSTSRASDYRASDYYSHRRSESASTRTSILSPASSTFPLVAAKERSVSGSKLRSDSWTGADSPSSSTPVPTTPPAQSDIFRVNAPSRSSHSNTDDEAVTPVAKRPLSRRRNLITLNPDGKTFSLLPQGQQARDKKAPTLSLSTSASHERLSSDAFSVNRPSSTVTSLPDRSFSATLTPASSTTQLAGDPIANTVGSSSSPWNYRMVGGLRKVPNTPDLKGKQKSTLLDLEPDAAPPYPSSPSGSRLAPLPEAPAADPPSSSDLHGLQPKTSFQSSLTASTTSEKTNYKVYASNSPPDTDTDSVLHPPSTTSETTNYRVYVSSSAPATDTEGSLPPPHSRHSNYEILGRSSPPEPSSAERSPPKTADSDLNYIVHGRSSPAPSSLASSRRRLRAEYSQESLLVAPLKPQKKKKRSNERFGYYKSRSRESLRRATSNNKTFSSAISRETAHNIINAPAAFYRSRILPGSPARQPDTKVAPAAPAPAESPMKAHPHQWSSQLSTVASESEGGSEPGSRSASAWSAPGRRGSAPLSNHSRQMLSISSSLAANEERSLSHSRSFTDSLERPQAAHSRGGTLRLVSDQDEHGDGLTELHQLHNRPSRTRLSSFLSSSSSDRNLHSSSSSRANSLNSSSIPAWARFYYGSGERRWLASSSDSMTDLNDSRPPSSFQSRSPSAEHLPLGIYSQRRRPREVNPAARPISDAGSLEISQAPLQAGQLQGLKKKTSSIWSPHLRRDQRAGRYSIWEPPSMTWSTESYVLGKRNMQVVLFALGFIFPFAWMIAAFLPLPPDPHAEMAERDPRSSLLDEERDRSRRVAAVDETLFQSARWWRALNRYMSVIGILVVGAIAALVILGVKQGWGQTS
ncbi:hypothetical protein CCHL11_10326 [Colletotrichum chlorophyti]|uniref:Serine-rich protein n=1 Tax=Colletotrichum chlorophyti TaxID=708187 RepID=A0A1Q8RBH0_9PEZI|nr:hypothetical protein CCHL11_10326 [Colletotrichum chlorophyti]